MSTLPTSFRLPPNLGGKAEPEVVEAIGYHDDAITDLQQAIPLLKSQIDAVKAETSTTSTTENVTTEEEATIINPSTIGGVNNQAGNTSYTTQPSDYGLYILLSDASPVAVQLAQGTSIQVPWFATFINQGAGLATLTPATGTISYPNNLGAASMPIPESMAATVVYDGTNFDAVLFPVPPQNTPAVASEWLASYDETTGGFTQTQPTVADVTGAAPLASPALTGIPTAPTAPPLTDDTQIATTGYADAAVGTETTRAEAAEALLAPMASPTFTGTVTQPAAPVLTAPTTATSATAGAASALPALPSGYLQISLGGTDYKIPYFAI